MDDERTQRRRESVRDLLYVLFRRKWVILGVLLATIVPVTIYTLQLPATYEAKSTLLVKPGRENIYVSPVGAPEGTHPPTIVQRVEEVIKSELEILKSRFLIRRVLAQFSIARLFPDNVSEGSVAAAAHGEYESPSRIELFVNRALQNLSAVRVQGTDVIEVTYRSSDRNIPADFINTLIDLYLERHLEVHQSRQTYDFFKSQSNQLEQQLNTAIRRLADYKKKYGIASFEQIKKLTVDKYAEAQAAKNANDTEMKETEKRIEELKKDLSEISEHRYVSRAEQTESDIINSLKIRLAALEAEKAVLVSKFKPGHYDIVRIDQTMEKLREMLATEEDQFHGVVNTALSGVYQKIETDLRTEETSLEALRVKGVEIKKQSVEYGQELERLGRLEPELKSLQRAVRVNEENYRLYITKFEESRVSDAMDAARMVSVSVIEPATDPVHPVPMNKGLKVFLSLCIGAVAGFGLAFLLEYLDHSLKVPEDVEDNLKVTVFGTIDALPIKELEERENLEAIAARPQAPVDYQILKSNMTIHGDETGLKVLSICSPSQGEGASTVALNLAAYFAKDNGIRVVLVDANLRKPFLHNSLKLPASPGLAEVINEDIDVHEALKQSVIPGLFIITSGISPPRPSAIFESRKLVDLIKVLRREFDWIIFDCAPVHLYPDATLLARQLDGAVLVVQAENRTAEVAIRAKEQLEEADGKVLGAVLNRRRYVIPEKIYQRLS